MNSSSSLPLRMPGGDEASDNQRRRILKAVAELVAKRGYRDTTIERIAKTAGVGLATFHKHFEDKEACFLAAFDKAVEDASRRAIEAADTAGEEWRDRVRAGIASLFETIAAEPLIARMCLVEAMTAGPVAVDRYEAAIRLGVPLLRRGRDLSPTGKALPGALEETLAGGIAWTVQQQLATDGVAGLESLAPEMLQVAVTPYLGAAEAVRIAASLKRAK